MAAITYLASMALMALFLLVIVGAVAVGRDWQSYTPTLRPSGGSGLSAAANNENVWVALFILATLLVGGAATIFVSGDSLIAPETASLAGIVVGALLGLAFLFYTFYGGYRAAQARGLQKAAAVMAGAWILGIVFIGVIAANLLF
jgi:hypothetical protein